MDEYYIVVMAGGSSCRELFTQIRMYRFEWLSSALGLDFVDLLLVLGLYARGAH